MAFSLVFYCSLFKLYIITHIIFVNLFNNFHTFIIKFVYYIGPITVHTPINIYVTCGCCGKKHKCRIDGMNGDCDEEDEEED